MALTMLSVVVVDGAVLIGLALLGIGPLPIVAAAAAFVAGQLLLGPRCALVVLRARRTGPQQEPALHAAVERLCQLADIAKPAIAISELAAPAAFAVGRSQRSATICVSRGLLEELEPPELMAILAHELAHVESRDMVVMTAASVMATLAGLLLRIASWTGYSERWVVRTRMPGLWGLFGDELPGLAVGSVLSLVMVFVRLVLAVPLAVVLVVYALTLPAIAALSRARELAADRSAAILTGAPATLAAALLKLSGEIERLPTRDFRAAGLMNALLVVPIASVGGFLGRLIATHPPVMLRVERLLAMQTSIEGHPRAAV
jgi:heat shock protein HtpX